MDSGTLPLLQSPTTAEALERATPTSLRSPSGETFPIRKGIPILLGGDSLPGRNRFWGWIYDRIAFAYDIGVGVGWQLKLGGEKMVRAEYLQKIYIPPGAKVLETAVGTGANMLGLPSHASYFGIDISWNMLRKCQHNLVKAGRPAEIMQADAERLPFRNHIFDVVYHMGGIQFFQNPQRAIQEMARVTKTRGQLTIIDETASFYPTLKRANPERFEKNSLEKDIARLAPPGAENLSTGILSGGELYFLQCQTPP